MTALFISYRRSDSRELVERLHARLEAEFGAGAVFMDRSIKPGHEFPKVLTDALERCRIVLAVIGPDWATVTEANGVRRLHNPRDFVRIELETGLRRQVHVVPVLVGGVQAADLYDRNWKLPESLVPLRLRQTAVVSDTDFENDLADLVQRLKELLARGPAVPAAAPDADARDAATPVVFDQEFGNVMAESAMGNRL